MKIALFALLIAGPTLAQEVEEAPAEGAAPTEETDLLSEEAPAEESPAEEAPAEESPASPQLPIEISLTNGLTIKGTASQMDLISWAPGQPLLVTPDGGVAVTIVAGKIAAIVQPGVALRSTPEASAAPAPATTEANYTSPDGFSHPNPASSRYLYAPSSIPMKKGQGYVSQKYGIFSSLAYAPSDNFTMLFGTLTFFPPAMTIFGGKAGVQVSENVHISAGGEIFIFPIDTEVLATIGFGAITLGHEDAHVTLATGYIGGEMFDEGGIPVMLGGQVRLSSSVALVTENWIVLDPQLRWNPIFIATAAVRLLGQRSDDEGQGRRLRSKEGFPSTTWDFGLIAFSDGDEVYAPLPWVDWTWHFGPSGAN